MRGAPDELDPGIAGLDAVEEHLVVMVDAREEQARLGDVLAERLGAGVERLGDGVGGVEVVAVAGGDSRGHGERWPRRLRRGGG